MIKCYSTHLLWARDAAHRGLTIQDETGYTEDLMAGSVKVAYNGFGKAVGHCVGGPAEEVDAILCTTVHEYDALVKEVRS